MAHWEANKSSHWWAYTFFYNCQFLSPSSDQPVAMQHLLTLKRLCGQLLIGGDELENELIVFNYEKQHHPPHKLVEWWAKRQTLLPILSALVKKLMLFSPTSVSAERIGLCLVIRAMEVWMTTNWYNEHTNMCMSQRIMSSKSTLDNCSISPECYGNFEECG